MKHLKKGRKFGRERNQRRALMKSLASSFFMLGRIVTGEEKAKELRPFVERVLTKAKNPNIANRRNLRKLFSEGIVKKIIEMSATINRPGGYTRIVKLGARRRDLTRMAIIELVK